MKKNLGNCRPIFQQGPGTIIVFELLAFGFSQMQKTKNQKSENSRSQPIAAVLQATFR